MDDRPPVVTLRPVDAGSWRDVARLTVAPGQERFVAAPTYYLALCSYGDVWRPLAASTGRRVTTGGRSSTPTP